MKKLREIVQEISTYEKVKALYDRPGTPGEKAAAKAALDRISKSSKREHSSGHYEGFGYYIYHPQKRFYRGPYDDEAFAGAMNDFEKGKVVHHFMHPTTKKPTWKERSESRIYWNDHTFDPKATWYP